MIGWLNVNQGFLLGILVFLTLVYVIGTLCMAWCMLRSIRQTTELEKQRTRPAVIFNVLSGYNVVHAVMKNIGLTPAYHVKVKCTPSITHRYRNKEVETPLTARSVSFLAPQQEIRDCIGAGNQFYERYPDAVFAGTVEYKGRSGTLYHEDFCLDLSALRDRLYLSRVDIGKELEKIRTALDHLATGFHKPIVRTISEAEYQKEQTEFRERHRKRRKKKDKKDGKQREQEEGDSETEE